MDKFKITLKNKMIKRVEADFYMPDSSNKWVTFFGKDKNPVTHDQILTVREDDIISIEKVEK